jgi:hypothetical protein
MFAAAGRLVELVDALTATGAGAGGEEDAARVDRIRLLEQLKAAAAAAQAVETAAFVAGQRARQKAAGVPAARLGRGIAAQVGLARRISPFQATRYTGWATILTTELPCTFAELAAGRTSEWRAMLLARETGWLSREHRATIDRQLAPRLEQWGDRRVEAEAKKLAYRLDPHGYLDRLRAAENDRRVWLRPAPDTMARLTALLPIAQGVATHTVLARDADTLIAAGDPRRRGQIMADLLVERVTGQASADAVPVQINLVMTDQALLAPGPGRDEPAHLDGHGPLPAHIARHLITGPAETTPMWLRRLYTRPGTDQLTALDSRRRRFTAGQRHYLRLRDQWCRTPWCDAPIRHADHITPALQGGPTTTSNGQGYCVTCNHTKQAPGWHTTTPPDPGPHLVQITTPTGHRYHSRAPNLPTTTPTSPLEQRLARYIRRVASLRAA